MNDLSEKLTNANVLREQEKFSESAKEFTECLVQQITNQDYSGQIHSLCGQSLIYKILSRKTGNQVYKDLTLSFTNAALTVLENHQTEIDTHAQSIALSSHADSLLTNNKLNESLSYFEKAIRISPAGLPEKGRLKAHVGGVKYLLGEKQEGIKMIEDALTDIRTGNMDDYNIRVWETGALNGLAKIYAIESDTTKAQQIIEESLKISADHNLIIRKQEAEEIKLKLASGNHNFSL